MTLSFSVILFQILETEVLRKGFQESILQEFTLQLPEVTNMLLLFTVLIHSPEYS